MPKYKKQLILKPSELKSDFRILTKGQRIQIRASYPKKDVEVEGVPVKWEHPIKINDRWRLKFGISQVTTNLTLEGELIGLLVCSDGRKLRLTEKDFTVRDFGKLKTVLRSRFASKIPHDREVLVQKEGKR